VNPNDGLDARDPIGASDAPEPVGRRMAVVVGVVAGVLVIAALVGVAWVSSRTSELERELTVARHDARSAKAAGAAMSRRVAEIEATVATPPSGPATAGDDSSAAVASDIRDLTDCVNAYMDTIGTWSTDVRSRYTYDRC